MGQTQPKPKASCVAIVGLSAAALGVFLLVRRLRRDRIPTEWAEIGQITDLFVYPVKSCGAVKVSEISCTPLGFHKGLMRDRVFMVVDADTRKFVTARQYPKLVLVQPSFGESGMTLSAPSMEPIFVDPEVVADQAGSVAGVWEQEIPVQDCGDDVARWLSQYVLGREVGLRLVFYPFETPTRAVRANNKHPNWPNMTREHVGATHDASSYMMVTEESMRDLNGRLQNQVTPLWFRPNFVTRLLPSWLPYSEDDLSKINFIRVGETAVFKYVKPCSRCVFTTINPETGEKDGKMEPLRTLRGYRKIPECGESPIFGAHLGLVVPGEVKKGDKLYVGTQYVN